MHFFLKKRKKSQPTRSGNSNRIIINFFAPSPPLFPFFVFFYIFVKKLVLYVCMYITYILRPPAPAQCFSGKKTSRQASTPPPSTPNVALKVFFLFKHCYPKQKWDHSFLGRGVSGGGGWVGEQRREVAAPVTGQAAISKLTLHYWRSTSVCVYV